MSMVCPPGMSPQEYYGFLKEKRKKMASFYEENEKMTVRELAKHFKVSEHTAKKALEENGVEVDRLRNPKARVGLHYEQHTCLHCGEKYRHYCDEKKVKEIEPGLKAPHQSPSKTQELLQELDHVPIQGEDWAWTDDRILDLLYRDGVSPQELNQLLQGNQTPYPTVDSAIRAYKEKRPFAVYRQRYMVQFLKGDRDYPKGIPLHQLVD